jgi:hypothetical protein
VRGKVWKRRRLYTRQMQAAIDGRAESPRKAKPPFIEPAHLKAGFDRGGDALVWIAIWNPGRGLAVAFGVGMGGGFSGSPIFPAIGKFLRFRPSNPRRR